MSDNDGQCLRKVERSLHKRQVLSSVNLAQRQVLSSGSLAQRQVLSSTAFRTRESREQREVWFFLALLLQ